MEEEEGRRKREYMIYHYTNVTDVDESKGRSLRLKEARTCKVGCVCLYECG